MSTESLNRTSVVIETPRVNVDVLKQRLLVQKKKERVKNKNSLLLRLKDLRQDRTFLDLLSGGFIKRRLPQFAFV